VSQIGHFYDRLTVPSRRAPQVPSSKCDFAMVVRILQLPGCTHVAIAAGCSDVPNRLHRGGGHVRSFVMSMEKNEQSRSGQQGHGGQSQSKQHNQSHSGSGQTGSERRDQDEPSRGEQEQRGKEDRSRKNQ